jgi:hypothetical protein
MPDERMADIYFRRNLASPLTPADWKNPENWPPALRAEWSDDEGRAAARRHREELVKGFRAARAALDAFRPDLVLVWGDDQYENFKEDLIPPFSVYAMREVEYRGGRVPNVWNEGPDRRFKTPGHQEAGMFLARELIKGGFDVACSWKLHHMEHMGHAFGATISYLDWDRRGFPYPVIPFHVNCYGSDMRIPGPGQETAMGRRQEAMPVAPPPSPPPWRCYDLGKAVARILRESPWRAVVVGSSSWSHASLTKKHHYLYPDVEVDRRRYQELKGGQQHLWRDLDPGQIRESGQHEILNWVCLAGAMEGRKAEVLAYSETYVFNSSKAVALFPP